MVVIIPAAGLGSRFSEAGYTLPKPLIPARGVPMIRRVADMFPGATILAITRPELDSQIRELGINTVCIQHVQQGAALSILSANGHLPDDEEVVVVNSDNIFDYPMEAFLTEARKAAGGLLTFTVDGGPWSYARLNDSGTVELVVEKQQISNIATAGAYYFRSWRLLRRAICKMLAAGDTYNGEYYLAPTYNRLISEGFTVVEHRMPAHCFISLGTPDALEKYNHGG